MNKRQYPVEEEENEDEGKKEEGKEADGEEGEELETYIRIDKK